MLSPTSHLLCLGALLFCLLTFRQQKELLLMSNEYLCIPLTIKGSLKFTSKEEIKKLLRPKNNADASRSSNSFSLDMGQKHSADAL